MTNAAVRTAVCVLLAVAVAPAFAQSATTKGLPADEAGVALAEIVVTAQKRETNLQQTPISVSVLNAAGL